MDKDKLRGQLSRSGLVKPPANKDDQAPATRQCACLRIIDTMIANTKRNAKREPSNCTYPCGVHKGKPISEVPMKALEWLADNARVERYRDEALNEICRRDDEPIDVTEQMLLHQLLYLREKISEENEKPTPCECRKQPVPHVYAEISPDGLSAAINRSIDKGQITAEMGLDSYDAFGNYLDDGGSYSDFGDH